MTPPPAPGPAPPRRPGEMPVLLAALAIGLLLMALQLWLLTVAFDLYLAGERGRIWPLAWTSAAVFVGGVVVRALLRTRPSVSPRP